MQRRAHLLILHALLTTANDGNMVPSSGDVKLNTGVGDEELAGGARKRSW